MVVALDGDVSGGSDASSDLQRQRSKAFGVAAV
jgi:hypothetical protein